MSKSLPHTPPAWQSKVLVAGALAALAAVELSAATYATQTASRDQILVVLGIAIWTDVVLKTAMSLAAGLALALGPVIALHHWRSGTAKAKRQLAVLAAGAALVGLFISTSNLSGYYAWTRQQNAAEVTRSGALYELAEANAARAIEAARTAGAPQVYLSSSERALLEAGQAPVTAARTEGDIGRALLILALVSAMATAYRLPEPAKQAKRSRARKRNDTSELDGARAKRA